MNIVCIQNRQNMSFYFLFGDLPILQEYPLCDIVKNWAEMITLKCCKRRQLRSLYFSNDFIPFVSTCMWHTNLDLCFQTQILYTFQKKCNYSDIFTISTDRSSLCCSAAQHSFYWITTTKRLAHAWPRPDHDLTMTWFWPDYDLTMTWPWPDHDLTKNYKKKYFSFEDLERPLSRKTILRLSNRVTFGFFPMSSSSSPPGPRNSNQSNRAPSSLRYKIIHIVIKLMQSKGRFSIKLS